MRAILTYHSIDPSDSVISASAETFRRHVDWLASGRVRVTTVSDLLGSTGDEDALALTFDDAFENFASVAWPMLRDAALPVTVFVVSDRAGGQNDWEANGGPVPSLPLLGWETLGRLAEEGVDLGAHSRTHPNLRTLSADALGSEIAGAAARIRAETGAEPHGFAYPYGAYDEGVVDAVRPSLRWACTTDLRPLRPAEDPHRLPRLDTYYYRRPGALEAFGTTRFRWRLGLRAGARRARRFFTDVAG